MNIPVYNRTTYNNRGAPANGPTNLNKSEAQLKALSDEFTDELIRPATTKATIVDTDEVGGNNSAASFKWVKWTWGAVKAWLKAYFDPLYGEKSTAGTYTPTAPNGTNMDIVSVFPAMYIRVGSKVQIGGRLLINITNASLLYDFYLSLPSFVVNNFTSENQGNGSATSEVGTGASIKSGTGGKYLIFQGNGISATGNVLLTYSCIVDIL